MNGATITYTNMPTQTNGSGRGLTLNYTANGDLSVAPFNVGFAGSGYEVGDTFKFLILMETIEDLVERLLLPVAL